MAKGRKALIRKRVLLLLLAWFDTHVSELLLKTRISWDVDTQHCSICTLSTGIMAFIHFKRGWMLTDSIMFKCTVFSVSSIGDVFDNSYFWYKPIFIRGSCAEAKLISLTLFQLENAFSGFPSSWLASKLSRDALFWQHRSMMMMAGVLFAYI